MLALTAGLLCLSHVLLDAPTAPQTEPQKIESLIAHIESLKDAKFVRNGVAYDAPTAGQFLRGKWKTQESEVKTAKDFIDKVATKSSTTGQPYLIRLPDGKELPSAEYLTKELSRIDSKP